MLAHSPAYAQAYQEARSWGVGGSKSRALSAAETLITGALGGQGDLQLAANTLAPYAAAAIGKRFGHGEHKNEAAQAIGHFMLGAALAYANGADPLAGGSAAVAAERAAGYLAKQYDDGKTAIDPTTGKFNPNLLPEPIKEEIKAQTGVIASVVGAAGGSLKGGSKSSTNGTNINALFNAQVGGVLGQNAVGNNYLSPGLTIPFVDKEISPDQIKKFGQELGENCGKTGNKASCAATYDKWKNLSYKQGGLDPNDTSWENFVALMYQQEVLPLCKGNKSCEAHVVTSMQLNVVLNAGDAAGLRDSIEVDRRAVNIANGNWVRAGLDTLGDVSTILGMRAMVNPNSAYSRLMNSVFATPSKTGMPRSTTQLGIVGNWEQKALPKPQLPKDYRYDLNIGKNNPNFNKELHKTIYDQDPRRIEAVKARDQVNKANRERIKNSPHSLVLEKDVHGNEIFYRRISYEDFMKLKTYGELPATSETFISPLKAYSEQGYNGVLVKFTTKPGTMDLLKKIGTTGNSATNRLFPDLPRTGKGWTEKTQVQFKLEGQGKPYVNKGKGVVNTGLGRAGGKETFEKQIIYFEKIGDVK